MKGLGLRQTYFVEHLSEGEEPGTFPLPKTSVTPKRSISHSNLDVCRVALDSPEDSTQWFPSIPAEVDDIESITLTNDTQIMDSRILPNLSKLAQMQQNNNQTTMPSNITCVMCEPGHDMSHVTANSSVVRKEHRRCDPHSVSSAKHFAKVKRKCTLL